MRLSRLLGVVSLLVAAPAFAQEPAPTDPAPAPDPVPADPPPPPPPPPTPMAAPPGADVGPPAIGANAVLPNIMSARRGLTVDTRLDYTYLSDDFFADVFLMALNAHVQYLTPQGYGGYVSLPYHYASGDNDTLKGIGNLEVGGLYVLPQGAGSDLLLRAGIALDSAGQSGALIGYLSQFGPRLYDSFTTGLASTWLRGMGQYTHASGTLRLGVSGAINVPVNGDDGFDVNAIAGVAASAGVEQAGYGAAVGLVVLAALGGESDDTTILGLNATVDIPVSPTMKLYFAAGYPELEDNDGDLFSLGVGLRIAVN